MCLTGAGVPLAILAGGEGIALAYVVSMLGGTAYSLLMLSRVAGLELDLTSLGKFAGSTVIMGSAVHSVAQLISSPILQITLGLLVGVGVYLVLLFVLRAMSEEDLGVIKTTIRIAREMRTRRRDKS